MSRIFTPNAICERALRLCGAFSLSESAADGEQMREALFWLDLIMAELTGTEQLLSLVNDHVRIPLAPGVSEIPLRTLGDMERGNGLQFPLNAWLEGPTGTRMEVTVVARDTFIEVRNRTTHGPPRFIYINRGNDASIELFPFPAPDSPAGHYTLVMAVQSFADDLSPSGTTGDRPNNSEGDIGLAVAWQRFLIYSLAADIGSGAVAPISPQRVQLFRMTAEQARGRLLAVQNREWDNEPPIVHGYALDGYAPSRTMTHRSDYGRKLR